VARTARKIAVIEQPQAAAPANENDAVYNSGNLENLERYRKWLRAFESNKNDELVEQRLHRKYYHGKQWTDLEIAKLKKRGQAPIFDNRIGRKIDFIVGVEERMRRDPKGLPRTPKHEQQADVATASVRFVCDICRWEMIASDGMRSGLTSGIGVCWVGIEQQPNGENEVKLRFIEEDKFFYDPRSVKADFSDARYMGVHLWVDIDEAKEMHPKFARYFDDLMKESQSGATRFPLEQDRDEQWGDFENRRVRLVELYELRYDEASQKVLWHYCRFTADITLDSMVSPYTDEFGQPDNPYKAWSAYIDEKGVRYSPIRNMRPMQDEVNHRRSRFLHFLNSNKMFIRDKGGDGDTDKLKAEIAKPDAIIDTNGMKWGEDIGMIDQSKEVRGQFELLAQSEAAMENIGPNPGLAGKGQGVEGASGRALLAQRDSGMTELSPVFKSQRDWKLRIYRAVWFRARQAWTNEKYIKITDDPRSIEFIGVNQLKMDPATGRIARENAVAEIDVDIILDEGPDTVIMQEELMQTLAQLAGTPPNLWKVFVELSGVSNKERLNKLIDEAQAPPPALLEMQAKMAKLEELLQAVKVEKELASVENTRADTLNKLKDATTEEPQPTDDFGNPMGEPKRSNIPAGFALMKAFPVDYGEPTLPQQALMADMGPPPGMEPNGPQEAPQGPPPGMPMNDMMPPGPMPEGAELPGGLPVQDHSGF